MAQTPLRMTIAALVGALWMTACTDVPLDTPLAESPAEAPGQTMISGITAVSCPALFAGAADTSVTYVNKDKGISFAIPYNAQWGYADSTLSAYSEHDSIDGFPLGYVLFGPPVSGSLEGLSGSCDLAQQYQLAFLPARTAAQAVHDIEGRNTEIVPNTQVQTINGHQVVRYTDVGLCSYPTMEVIGQKYNYSFTTGCGADSAEEWEYLESVVKSTAWVMK